MVSRNHGVADGSLPLRLVSSQAVAGSLALTLYLAVVTALFVSTNGAEALPRLYLIAAVVLPVVYLAQLLVEYRIPTGAYVVALLAVVPAVMGGFAASVGWWTEGPVDRLYLPMAAVPLLVTVAVLAEDVLLGALYDPRELRTKQPRVLAAGAAGTVLAAALASVALLVLPPSGLLVMAAVAAGVAVLAAMLAVAGYPAAFSTRPSLGDGRGTRSLRTRAGNGAGPAELTGDRFSRLLFGHHLLRIAAKLLILFLFLDVVYQGLGEDTDRTVILLLVALAAAQAVGVGALVVSGLPILFRFGLRTGLVLNPLVISVLVVVLLAVTALGDPSDRTLFWLITAVWSTERVVSIALADPAVNAARRVQSDRLRFGSLAAAEGLAGPLGAVFAGLVLMALTADAESAMRPILLVLLGITTAWGATALLVAGGYRATLIARLQRPSLEGLGIPVQTAESLSASRALLEGSPAQAAVGLDMLRSVGGERYHNELLRLLDTSDEERTIIDVIERVGDERPLQAFDGLRARLGPTNSNPVRVAAMAALVACEPHGGAAVVEPLLVDEDQQIRAGAVLAMLNGAVLRQHDVALGALAIMVHSNTPAKRRDAAMILGRTAPPSHRELLANLLTDGDVEVRAAAIEAIGLLNLSGHTPLVLDSLEDPRTRQAAASAIHAFGNGAVPGASVALADPDRSEIGATRIVQVLAAGPTPGTTSLLAGRLQQSSPAIRAAVAAGLVGNPYLDSARLTVPERINRMIRPVVTEEARAAAELYDALRLVPDGRTFGTLTRTLFHRADGRFGTVCNLLAVRYRRPQIGAVAAQLLGPSSAAAVDLLESVVSEPDRQLVADLVARRRRAIPGADDPDGDLTSVLSVCDDDWAAAAAIHGAALSGMDLGSIGRPDGIIGPMQEATLSWSRRRILAGATGAEPTADLKRNGRTLTMAIVEKTEVLRRCRLFGEAADDDVIRLAELAEQVTVGPGDGLQTIGLPVDALYFVVSGELEESSADGDPVVRRAGDTVGELLLLRGAVAVTDVLALRSAEVLRLRRDALLAEIDLRPDLARAVIVALAAAVDRVDRSADGASLAPATEPERIDEADGQAQAEDLAQTEDLAQAEDLDGTGPAGGEPADGRNVDERDVDGPDEHGAESGQRGESDGTEAADGDEVAPDAVDEDEVAIDLRDDNGDDNQDDGDGDRDDGDRRGLSASTDLP